MNSSPEPADFAEWAVVRLLERHCFGCTRYELGRFSGLEHERIAAALSRLEKVHAIESAPYARGTNFFLAAGN